MDATARMQDFVNKVVECKFHERFKDQQHQWSDELRQTVRKRIADIQFSRLTMNDRRCWAWLVNVEHDSSEPIFAWTSDSIDLESLAWELYDLGRE